MAQVKFESGRVERDLSSIEPRDREKILEKIDRVFRRGEPAAKSLRPLKNSKLSRLRVGNFRVMYYLKDDCYVISAILNRRDAYSKK